MISQEYITPEYSYFIKKDLQKHRLVTWSSLNKETELQNFHCNQKELHVLTVNTLSIICLIIC